MTVTELIALLQSMPPDAIVLASHGDPMSFPYSRPGYYVKGPYGDGYHDTPRRHEGYTNTPCHLVSIE